MSGYLVTRRPNGLDRTGLEPLVRERECERARERERDSTSSRVHDTSRFVTPRHVTPLRMMSCQVTLRHNHDNELRCFCLGILYWDNLYSLFSEFWMFG